jgi:hypothetical protein
MPTVNLSASDYEVARSLAAERGVASVDQLFSDMLRETRSASNDHIASRITPDVVAALQEVCDRADRGELRSYSLEEIDAEIADVRAKCRAKRKS